MCGPWLALLCSAVEPGYKGQLTCPQNVHFSTRIELAEETPLYI